MAVDQFLLQNQPNEQAPVLRIYTWDHLTLSIGSNQKLDEFDLEFCREHRIQLVRRATGGKAVLHGTDLTYSVVGSTRTAPFNQGILSTYRALSQPFISLFESLGLNPQVQTDQARNSLRSANEVCFVTPSSYEILIGGRKIIGSAQRQSKGCFLQHGTIPLQDQVPLLAGIFKHANEGLLRRKVTSLEVELKAGVPTEEAIRQRLVECFAQSFQVNFKHNDLSGQDWAIVAEVSNKFTFLDYNTGVEGIYPS